MAKGNRGGKRTGASGGAITTGTSDLDYTKVGKSFEKLPKSYQDRINNGLKMSTAMQNDIANGRKYKMTDTWTTGTAKSKYTVITDVIADKVVYTIKQRNKILKKNMTKSQCANAVASIYLKILNS